MKKKPNHDQPDGLENLPAVPPSDGIAEPFPTPDPPEDSREVKPTAPEPAGVAQPIPYPPPLTPEPTGKPLQGPLSAGERPPQSKPLC